MSTRALRHVLTNWNGCGKRGGEAVSCENDNGVVNHVEEDGGGEVAGSLEEHRIGGAKECDR
jgi:hypothetical protein